ncbi:MAG: DUF2846 domain-containing protein [Deltaproteobacteria bacterium]|nr:DUF2846 domain-containing protein [Deltaproteobacteria bacterium]
MSMIRDASLTMDDPVAIFFDMKKNKLILTLSVVFVLLVFSSAAIGAETAFAPAPAPQAGYVLVYVYRPDCPPTMKNAKILVNGTEVARLANKSYTWFYLKEGVHSIMTNWSRFFGTAPQVSLPVAVKSGDTRFLRLGGVSVQHSDYTTNTSDLVPVDAKLASKEMPRLKKYSQAAVQTVD